MKDRVLAAEGILFVHLKVWSLRKTLFWVQFFVEIFPCWKWRWHSCLPECIGPPDFSLSENTFKNIWPLLDKVYIFLLTQSYWVERSKVKQEQCVLNTEAIDFSSRGKLKVEDTQGQIVCTLRGKNRGEWWSGILNWAETQSWPTSLLFLVNGNYFCQVIPGKRW